MTTPNTVEDGQRLLPAETRDSVVYRLEGVAKSFGSGRSLVTALQGVDLTVQEGEFMAVVGASGSGKTTLLQLLGALDRPSAGSIACLGRRLEEMSERELTVLRRDHIGFVFQQFNLIPTLTARQNVEAKLAATGGADAARADELLAAVGLAGRSSHLPSQLSGGEQQRVAIARALASNPSVLLADEPTGNLDTTSGQEILDLLRTVSAENGQTVVLITHDRVLASSTGRVVELSDGRIISDHRGGERVAL